MPALSPSRSSITRLNGPLILTVLTWGSLAQPCHFHSHPRGSWTSSISWPDAEKNPTFAEPGAPKLANQPPNLWMGKLKVKVVLLLVFVRKRWPPCGPTEQTSELCEESCRPVLFVASQTTAPGLAFTWNEERQLN